METKITPFSFINTIFIDDDLELNEETKLSYIKPVINIGLSYHKECIFLANEMNQRPGIDEKLHFDFYKYSVRKYKRPYVKWVSKDKSEELDLIKKYFGYSTEKALEVIDLISPDQIITIKEKLNMGGINK